MKVAQKKHKLSPFNRLMIIFIISLCGLAVLGLIFGAFWDLQIDKAVSDYKVSSDHTATTWYGEVGKHLSAFAPYLATVIFVFALVCVLTFNPWYKKYSLRGKIIYFIIAYVVVIFLAIYQAFDAFVYGIEDEFHNSIMPASTSIPILRDFNTSVRMPILLWGIPVGIILVAGFSCLNFFWLNKKVYVSQTDVTKVFRWAVFATVAMLLGSLIVWVMKDQLHRERFFQLATNDSYERFKPWYSLIWNMNTDNDIGTKTYKVVQYTSFPSGHTTWAMTLCVFIPFLGLIKIKDQKKLFATQVSVTVLIGVFILLIMFARLLTGSHYLSDVSIAVVINMAAFICCYFILDQFLLNKNKK